MTLLNDLQIAQYVESHGMISPYVGEQVRQKAEPLQCVPYKVISYGQSSYGYDIRLACHDFRIFRHVPGLIVDPKDFSIRSLKHADLERSTSGNYFILPGNSYGLGVSVERFQIPRNVTAIALGKSTYARIGVIVNITPLEAGWEGYLTIEVSNSSNADCRIYAEEGIAQLLFFEGEPCKTSYADRGGKYQGQSQVVSLPKV